MTTLPLPSSPLPPSSSSPPPSTPPTLPLSTFPDAPASAISSPTSALLTLHQARLLLLPTLPPLSSGFACPTCGGLRTSWSWKVVRGGVQRGRAGGGKKKSPGKKSPAKKNALRGRCEHCGSTSRSRPSDPATLASFPPARRSTRSSLDPSTEPIDITNSVSPPPNQSKPHPPTLLASPHLLHLPTSSEYPNPQTEPLPILLPSSLPASSASSRSASPSAQLSASPGGKEKEKGEKKKRAKKSGLGRLLAESEKRREEEEERKGMLGWGLG